MKKFTSGIWKSSLGTFEQDLHMVTSECGIICHINKSLSIDEQKANATLISEAPNMIEAIELFLKFFDDMPKGQLGKISCDIGLLNDAFIKSNEILKKINNL